jgi:hypothetical protein
MDTTGDNIQNIAAHPQLDHLTHLAEAGCEKDHLDPVVFGWSAIVEEVADHALHTVFACMKSCEQYGRSPMSFIFSRADGW